MKKHTRSRTLSTKGAKVLRLGLAPAASRPPPSAASKLTFGKILVPIDFSKPSRAAALYAVKFATQHNSQLVLLHVVVPILYASEIGYHSVPMAPLADDFRGQAKARLEQFKSDEIRPGMKVDLKVRVGQPYHEIVEAAREIKADLIIIATHGHTGLKHVLLGSTAERVVRHAACPVLTVRKK